MARTPMITRTITTYVVELKCLSNGADTCERVTMTMPASCDTAAKQLKYARKNLHSDANPVAVAKADKIEQLYAMPIDDFAKHAKQVQKPETKPAE